MTKPTDLYRHFDKEGRLLYVGISFRAIIRQASHASTASWWDDIETIKVERFESREAALAAEKAAVENEKPVHNKQWVKRFTYRSYRKHNLSIDLPGAPDMAAAVVDWYLSLTSDRKMPKALCGLADKFDQTTEAGRAYATTIRALERFHRSIDRTLVDPDEEIERKKQAAERTKAGMAAKRAAGWTPGPGGFLATGDPKLIKAIRADLGNAKLSWKALHKKHGVSVGTLRKYFLEERRQVLADLETDDTN